MKLPFFFSHKQSSPLIINNLLTPSWVLGWGKIDQTKENISGHDPNLIIYHTQPTISTNQKIIIVGDICLTNLPQLQKKLDISPTTNPNQTVAELWQNCGLETFLLLEGIFALAIWDKQKENYG